MHLGEYVSLYKLVPDCPTILSFTVPEMIKHKKTSRIRGLQKFQGLMLGEVGRNVQFYKIKKNLENPLNWSAQNRTGYLQCYWTGFVTCSHQTLICVSMAILIGQAILQWPSKADGSAYYSTCKVEGWFWRIALLCKSPNPSSKDYPDCVKAISWNPCGVFSPNSDKFFKEKGICKPKEGTENQR